MNRLTASARLKLPFLIAGFLSFLFSVWLYFVQGETTAGIFVGKGKMKVVDLSLKGLKIELSKRPELYVNDQLAVEFRLKDKKRTLIRENASVRSIEGHCVGSAFGPDVSGNTSLGFYLLG